MARPRKPLKDAIVKAIADCKFKGRYVRLSSYFTTSQGYKVPESLDMIVDVNPSLSEKEVQKRLNRISVVYEFKLKKKVL